MFRKIDQMWDVQQVRWIERLSFSQLLILRLSCHQRCGASHFLTAYFCGWVLAIAQPHGELAQPGDLTLKTNSTRLIFVGSVTHCMLLGLVERKRLEIGGRLSMSYKELSTTILFPANTWLWNCWVSVNKMNMQGFYLCFSFCTFVFSCGFLASILFSWCQKILLLIESYLNLTA